MWALLGMLVTGLAAVPTEGVVTAATRDWVVPFDGTRCWTIRQLSYRDRLVSHANGFHGTVIATGRPVKPGTQASFIGTGHDEGGREQVETVTIEHGGETAEPVPGRRYEGAPFVLRKQSRLAALRHQAEISILDDRLVEHHRYEAIEDQPVALLYAFMHCWQPTFGRFAAQLPDGQRLTGSFASRGGHQVDRDVQWSAIYDDAARVGVLTCYPEVYRAQWHGAGTFYWDLDRYHKQYLHLLGKGVITKGTRYDLTVVVRAFTAPPEQWVETAAALAADTYPSVKRETR